MRTISLILAFLISIVPNAQSGNSIKWNQWDADWINVPGSGDTDPWLYLFRKTLTLNTSPETFKIYVSVDDRFKLYVNEQLVSTGPALGVARLSLGIIGL